MESKSIVGENIKMNKQYQHFPVQVVFENHNNLARNLLKAQEVSIAMRDVLHRIAAVKTEYISPDNLPQVLEGDLDSKLEPKIDIDITSKSNLDIDIKYPLAHLSIGHTDSVTMAQKIERFSDNVSARLIVETTRAFDMQRFGKPL